METRFLDCFYGSQSISTQVYTTPTTHSILASDANSLYVVMQKGFATHCVNFNRKVQGFNSNHEFNLLSQFKCKCVNTHK